MTYARTIAIDGPAASGKSTLGTQLAEKLEYLFLDTGILYRAITAHALGKGIQIDHPEVMKVYASQLVIDIEQLRPVLRLKINGKEVSGLTTPTVNDFVPTVAAHPPVRERVRQIQRRIAAQGQVILAGRDIGTVVLPDAGLKVYLDASLAERAARRFASQSGSERTLKEIQQELLLRDTADQRREESPMRIAADAIVIKTDRMNVDQVAALVMNYARREVCRE